MAPSPIDITDDTVNIGIVEPPYKTSKQFGIIPNSVEDQTKLIQQAIDSFGSDSGILWFESGKYRITQLIWRAGVEIRGVGTKGSATQFIQVDGVNADAIVSDTNLPSMEWIHWSRLNNFSLIKEPGSTDTVGSGIALNHFTGEHCHVENLHVIGFPEDGIHIRHGGSPGYFTNLNTTNNERYGINLHPSSGGLPAQGIVFENISGDANGVALMNFESLGMISEQIVVRNVKSETGAAGRQQQVFRVKEVYGIGISISGVTALALNEGIGPNTAIVTIEEPFAGAINLENVGWEGYTYAIKYEKEKVYIPVIELFGGARLRYRFGQHWKTY